MRVWVWTRTDLRPDAIDVEEPLDLLEIRGMTMRRFETQHPNDGDPVYVYAEAKPPDEMLAWVRQVEGYMRRR